VQGNIEGVGVEVNKVYQGDCLSIMKDIPNKSVDMILADLPYGTTACKWDVIIPFESLWKQYKRIIKKNGAIVLTASQPFTTLLISSNMDWFKYCWIYQKTTSTNYLNAKKEPMRVHEDIVIFYNKQPTYNPQITTGHERKISSAIHKRNSVKTEIYNDHKLSGYDSTERYPLSVQVFCTDKQKDHVHPTQKPVALFEYLIKTYTNEGDLVLDNVCGSGTTGVACKLNFRDYILIEKEKKYVKIARDRINDTIPNKKLFKELK